MTVFYRKYRPQKFADLVGQEHISEALLAQLTSGKISHGYLFSGPRGSGKTSSARIFAKAVNCQKSDIGYQKSDKKKTEIRNLKSEVRFGEPCNKCDNCLAITNGSFLDLIEIDAASNRGIDEIRDLREKIKMSPVSGRFKVYIIDEAHMLTTEAFNALLKTLEEPPKHAIFILCTTNPTKLPSTIISRLTRFSFLRAGEGEIVSLLAKISKEEKINVDEESLKAIAKAADGAYRDAVSILDQLSATGKKITAAQVEKVVYASGVNMLLDFVGAVLSKDVKSAVGHIEKMAALDVDFSLFAKDVILLLESVLLVIVGVGDAKNGFEIIERDEIEKLSKKINFSQLQNLIKLFLVSEGEIKIYPLAKIPLILAVCKYCGEPVNTENAESQKLSEADFPKRSGFKKESDIFLKKVGPLTKGPSDTQQHRYTESLHEIEPKWGQFLEKVRPINVHILALLRSTRPVSFDGVSLTLEVFYKFHKDKLEEPKILTMLENFLNEVFERKISLRLILTQRTNNLPKVVEQSDVVDVSSEDLSAIAQEIFSK